MSYKNEQGPYGNMGPPPYYTAGSGQNLPYPTDPYAGPSQTASGPPPIGGTPYQGFQVPPQMQQQGQNFQAGYDSDAERITNNASYGFGDKAIRRGFIRKVYAILMLQLTLTAVFISLFILLKPLKLFVIKNSYLLYVAMIGVFVCTIIISCCQDFRRKFPHNVICLTIFTVCMSFMLGVTTAMLDTESVLIAVGICAVVTLCLTLFAFQTKYDFTGCGGVLCVFLVILIIAGFIMAFMPTNRYATIAYGAAGALIFSAYIVYDTQLMMGGKHKYSLSPEEYIFAAMSLYLDVINLFSFILSIVSASNN